MHCPTCPMYERDQNNLKQGFCHADPPVTHPIPNGILASWPAVPDLGWCGRHPERKPAVTLDLGRR